MVRTTNATRRTEGHIEKRAVIGMRFCTQKTRALVERCLAEQRQHVKKRLAQRLQLDADIMADVKDRLYGRCGRKRKMLHWNRCPKFILDPLIERLCIRANIMPTDTFVDIGSGIGNVVETVATRVGCHAVGLELEKVHHDVAASAKPLFDKYRAEQGLKGTTEFICDNVCNVDEALITNADVVWCANKLFPMKVNGYLIDLFKKMKPGARVIVMNDLYLHTRPEDKAQQEEAFRYFEFDDFHWGPGDVEWTDNPGELFMYTRTDYVYEE
eukprot:TRINITY_DN9838_c0_g1_i1.p1 TRINITY_DN9838_c0_g1~~TRINITY_DN9838_c0_g1_i1.p1  ORF type:complete len:270 (+),score=103.14 TRINITY_DN9838_c0_g1_i1:66-875(+)